MSVKIFQFNGCSKCFNETILLKSKNSLNVEFIADPASWSGDDIEVAVITGYLLPNDTDILENIASKSKKIIAYGSCTTTGGAFGLAFQKGHRILPLRKIVPNAIEINGCLGEVEELESTIEKGAFNGLKNLCDVCSRKSTCHYLEVVHRQIELEDNETCFNDLGYLCSGYIAKECKERCINYGTPCRGCKPSLERSGVRMLGMFGTLMGNIEVATEHSVKGATDKLADEDDDVTNSLPDVIGSFFRYTLPTSGLPIGRMKSSGTIEEDVFIGRLIEELPLIAGRIGGIKWISKTIGIIEAYEKDAKIEVSETTKNYRKELLRLEKDLESAVEEKDPAKYEEISNGIRKIAGNMNLSNVFYGGFKTEVEGDGDFNDYKSQIFEVIEGTYENDVVKYSLNSDGVITEIKIKEGI